MSQHDAVSVAVCSSVFQGVAVCFGVLQWTDLDDNDLVDVISGIRCVLQYVAGSLAVCYSVWQCVAVCCSVLQYVAVCCSVLQCAAVY